jgi:hypothetical protein
MQKFLQREGLVAQDAARKQPIKLLFRASDLRWTIDASFTKPPDFLRFQELHGGLVSLGPLHALVDVRTASVAELH